MSETEALAAIRALCNEAVEWQEIDPPMILVQEVRTILDQVQPATPRTIDREELLRVMTEQGFSSGYDPHSWRCYHPDRYGECDCPSEMADAILALVRPVEGIVLSPEEAACVRGHLRASVRARSSTPAEDALWEWLEAHGA